MQAVLHKDDWNAGTSDDSSASIRVLVVGDSAVGKTSFIDMIGVRSEPNWSSSSGLQDGFVERAVSTLGIATSIIRETVDVNFAATEVEVQLWEVGGNQLHRDARSVFYEGLDALLLVYDVSNAKSYHRLVLWLYEICTCQSPPSLRYWDAGGGSGGPDPEDLEFRAIDRAFARQLLGGRCPTLFVANKADLRPSGPREALPRPELPQKPPLLDRLLGFGKDTVLGAGTLAPADAELLERLRDFVANGRHSEASSRLQSFDYSLWRDFVRRTVEFKRKHTAE